MSDDPRSTVAGEGTWAAARGPAEPPSMAAAPQPWYQDGLRFGCTRCGACCRSRGYLWLSPPDIVRLAEHLGLSVEAFRAGHTREVVIEGQDQPGISVIMAPHGCRFLDDATNECTVHAARPTQCRTFPFWPMLIESREVWLREVGSLCGREAIEDGPVHTVEEIRALAGRIVATAPVPAEVPREDDRGQA